MEHHGRLSSSSASISTVDWWPWSRCCHEEISRRLHLQSTRLERQGRRIHASNRDAQCAGMSLSLVLQLSKANIMFVGSNYRRFASYQTLRRLWSYCTAQRSPTSSNTQPFSTTVMPKESIRSFCWRSCSIGNHITIVVVEGLLTMS